MVEVVGLGGPQARQVEAGVVTGERQETLMGMNPWEQDLGLESL